MKNHVLSTLLCRTLNYKKECPKVIPFLLLSFSSYIRDFVLHNKSQEQSRKFKYLWLFVSVFSMRRLYYFLFKKCFISHRNYCYDTLFFQLFRIKIKYFQIINFRSGSTERGSCDSLWFKMCWLDIRYSQNTAFM